MRRPVLVVLVLPVLAVAASCGLRSGVETGAGSRSASTTAAGLTPPTSAPALSSPKATPTLPPSTKAAGANAGVTTSKPPAPTTTRVAPATTKAPPPPPTTAKVVDKKAVLCAAAKIYAVDDLPGLGQRILADPDGLLKAYDDMVANATPELADGITKLGPFTRVVLAAVKAGEIKTPVELTNWLANAPSQDLEDWVLASQTVGPGLQTLCGTSPPA